MFRWSDVVPDDERHQWALDPFTSVGPLGFGMSHDEVSAALSGVTEESQRHRFYVARLEATPAIAQGEYRKFGLQLYYRQERLAGVSGRRPARTTGPRRGRGTGRPGSLRPGTVDD
jgi:hypothetical protein